MLTYIFLVSIFILLASPVFFIGFLIETREEKQRQALRDEIARQSRQ